MKRGVIALGLVLALCTPAPALAQDGFIGGLQDFAGVREVEQTSPEKEFNEQYEPQLMSEEQLRAGGETEETTVYGNITNTVRDGMTIEIDGTRWVPGAYYYGSVRSVLLIIVPIAILLVFFWWGVRKALRVIMASFRKGRMSV